MEKLHVAFAFLSPHEETVIKSFLKIIQKQLPFDILEEFKNDKKPKTVFINLNDKRARILFDVYKYNCPYDFVLVGNFEELTQEIGEKRVEEIKAYFPQTACKPLTLKKITDLIENALASIQRKSILPKNTAQPQKVSWFEVINNYSDKNILVFYQKDVFLLHSQQKQIYYSPKNECEILDCIKNSSEFLIQPIQDQELTQTVKEWNLSQSFLYDTFFYILYFTEIEKSVLQKSLSDYKKKWFRLKRYPNIFSQIHFFNNQRYFYKASAYLCRHQVSFDEITANLNLKEEIVARYLYALEQLNYLDITPMKLEIKEEKNISNVSFIFSKIKKMIGMDSV